MKKRIWIASLALLSVTSIRAGTFQHDFNTDPAGLVTFSGSAAWVDTGGVDGTGYVSITDNENSLQGTMTVPDVDAGEAVAGFDVTFKLRMGGGSANAADGFAFSFANDLPASFGEEGGGTGFTVAFDIYVNAGEPSPAIDIKVGGATVESALFAKEDILTGDEFVDVRITYENGLLDVDFKGEPVFEDLFIALPAIAGGSFGFGARTGGENNNHWIDDLSIETFESTQPTVAGIQPGAKGFILVLQDAATSALDPDSVTAMLDGEAVTPMVEKTGDRTVIEYADNPEFFEPGSQHELSVTFNHGDPATEATQTLMFTVPDYVFLSADAMLPEDAIDTSERGFIWRIHQVFLEDEELPNTEERAEDQLKGLLGVNNAYEAQIGPAEGPGVPAYDGVSTEPMTFVVPSVVNYSALIDTEADINNGNFVPDLQMPGQPGLWDTDNIAGEVLTALEFPEAGIYTMVVNSDDGFRTSAGQHPRDVGATVGRFEGPRGAADTVFYIYVEEAGIYPFRTLWYQGGGGANIEWFTITKDNTSVLINDTEAHEDAIIAYQLPVSALESLPAYVESVSPNDGSAGIVNPNVVEAVLVDQGTTVDPESISMTVNGEDVNVTSEKADGVTTVSYDAAGQLESLTPYMIELTYSDDNGPRTVSWSFTSGVLSANLFVIEAEDFDYDGGLSNPQAGVTDRDVNVMPYLGGAYDGLGAIEGIDYNNGDGNDSDQYRSELDANGEEFPDGNEVNISARNNIGGGNGAGGTISINSSDRGTFTLDSNYGIGWVGGGDWQNYTRVFPENNTGGWWKVFAGLSHGETAAGQLSGSLARVTSGHGTPDQTTEPLGSFSAPGSGGWANNNLVPMTTATGSDAIVKLEGENTVRFNLSSGDFDFLIFSEAAAPPPAITAAPVDSVKRNEVVLSWTMTDSDTEVDVSSVELMLDGENVTGDTTVEKTAGGATVTVDLTGTTFDPGEYSWQLSFTDSASPPNSVEGDGTFVVNPYPTEGTFVIEAEDFNYSEGGVSGLSNPMADVEGMDVNVMPYLGGAYDGLSAIEGIDFSNNDSIDAGDVDLYRTEVGDDGDHEVNMAVATGSRYSVDRGIFEMTTNYRIGWVGSGDWQNYTRVFPEDTYNVWAALSFGGTGGGQLNARLDRVTSDPSLADQTLEPLGTFVAPGSGGWGRNELVPMKDDSGNIVALEMGGEDTVRFSMTSGDFDYFLFVPTDGDVVDEIEITSIELNADGSITIQWVGGGVLELAESVLGPWTPVSSDPGEHTIMPEAGQTMLFIRIASE